MLTLSANVNNESKFFSSLLSLTTREVGKIIFKLFACWWIAYILYIQTCLIMLDLTIYLNSREREYLYN